MTLCGISLPFGRTKEDFRAAFAEDSDATNLSHVGTAVYETLRKKHSWHHNKLWNVTTGKVIGELQHTPGPSVFSRNADPNTGHSDWFPEKMIEVMSKTEVWCDVLSLAPPDGVFLEKCKEAIKTISERAKEVDPVTKMVKKTVVLRMIFGNLPAMPINCDAVLKKLTEDLPKDGTANIHIWVGSWRIGTSWNHAKIIAVDGKHLHTGGHNLWDAHYLRKKPVHDLSVELEGYITNDGHEFANYHWNFIRKKQDTCIGQIAERIPDSMPLAWKTRVIVSEFPESVAPEFPPVFQYNYVPAYEKLESSVPMIAVGRLGSLMGASSPILHKDRPSDDAFIAMIDSAHQIIKMTLQDLGPVCIPGTKIPLPGLKWPKPYLNALARVIWQKGVDVEIILSNPGSIPNDLSPTEACYGNGWSCVDVCAEIIKRVKKQFPFAEDDEIRKKVTDNLRVCFIRHAQGQAYADGSSIGLHSKHFIVDDVACYIGSQNLYVCDLAEWGIMIDHAGTVQKMLEEHWDPMWKASYTQEDVDVQEVMDSLDIDRDGEDEKHVSENTKKLLANQKVSENFSSANPEFYGKD